VSDRVSYGGGGRDLDEDPMFGDAFEAGGVAPCLIPQGGTDPGTSPRAIQCPVGGYELFEWSAKSTYYCERCERVATIESGRCQRCNGACRRAEDDWVVVANVAFRLSAGQADVGTNDVSDAFLVVTFGADNHGPRSSMAVDLMNGVGVPIVGRRAQFTVFYPLTSVNGATQPAIYVSVSIGISVGGGAGTKSPRRTVKIGDLQNNATSAVQAIPPFAASAAYTSHDATVAATLNQLVAPLNGAAPIADSPLNKLDSADALVANGARGFTLTASGGALTRAAVVFFLDPT
jgi:hypothetical protein